jgi:hypothetical protein
VTLTTTSFGECSLCSYEWSVLAGIKLVAGGGREGELGLVGPWMGEVRAQWGHYQYH